MSGGFGPSTTDGEKPCLYGSSPTASLALRSHASPVPLYAPGNFSRSAVVVAMILDAVVELGHLSSKLLCSEFVTCFAVQRLEPIT